MMSAIGVLRPAKITDEAQKMLDEDVADGGYVMNVSQLWAYQPAGLVDLLALARRVSLEGQLSKRQRGVLVANDDGLAVINVALGALPDAALRTSAARPALDAITFGRPIEADA